MNEPQEWLMTNPIYGYRVWSVDIPTRYLFSPNFKDLWTEEPIHAVHKHNKTLQHSSPQENCLCGIHAKRSMKLLTEDWVLWFLLVSLITYTQTNIGIVSFGINGIAGKIKLWGKVIEHEHGWRGEYGQIVELYLPEPKKNLQKGLENKYKCKVLLVDVPPNIILKPGDPIPTDWQRIYKELLTKF